LLTNPLPPCSLATENPEYVQWLLDHGADPNIPSDRGCLPITANFSSPTEKVITVADKLLAHGARFPPDMLQQMIRYAWREAKVEETALLMKFFIQKGADLHHVDAATGTPLHHAASFAFEPLIRILLDSGANPSILVDGKTPADVASDRKHDGTTKMLVEATRQWSQPPS
jgi:ankyrin repeat protein